MKNRKAKWFFLIVICLGAGCAVFLMPLVVRTYVVQAFKIPSGAMEPTLLIGDYILVDKKAHNLEALTRKDIIVFKSWDKKRNHIRWDRMGKKVK